MWARFLIALLLIYVGIKTFSWAKRFSAARSNPTSVGGSTGQRAVNEMVKDPVCGVYVPSDEAVTVVQNGRAVHFCSEDCRIKYLNGRG